MAEFSCAAAGADSCRWKTSSADEQELLAQVTEHLHTKHDVQQVSRTLASYAVAVARGEARPAEPNA